MMNLVTNCYNWFLACPWWVRYPVDAIVVLFLFYAAFLPIACVHRIDGLEQTTCKDGRKAFSLGPTTPYWISFWAALWCAYRAAKAVAAGSNGIHFGLDLSDWIECVLPFGITFPFPAELAKGLRMFAAHWYIPFAVCAVSTLLRCRIFKSAGQGFKYFALQLIAANAIYWAYGLFVAFVVMPIPLKLHRFLETSGLAELFPVLWKWTVFLFKLAWTLLGLLLYLAAMLFVAALPFMSAGRMFQRAEARIFYRNPGACAGVGWLAIAGSAVVAAVAAVPVGWANLTAKGGEKLAFFSGEKVAWTASVSKWNWTFQLPGGTAEVFSRMHWEIPVLLALAAFIVRIWVFKGPVRAAGQLVLFTLAGYVTAALYGAYYAAVLVPSLVGIAGVLVALGWLKAIVSGGGVTDSGSGGGGSDGGQASGVPTEESEQVIIDDGSWHGLKLTREGVHWRDEFGKYYKQNFDGTFERDNSLF